MHVPAPTLLFLMKLKNDLTCTRLWYKAPGHPAAFNSGAAERGWQAIECLCSVVSMLLW